ncbi:hypothetical protein [Bifidobacterium xylocopae]|uniref:Ribbon-helix-helix protein CopG domain-containing protein n=1 Tax=Bifidobacterium xylocopae TaxID=2493119 RepID=A0A366KDK9_9BIFI|nr:hypothetical protein [Bifidobacterium xylocopae]RBP98751.1 hypothetical protein CRD59_07385 [Bifidobacterium xylocopae]
MNENEGEMEWRWDDTKAEEATGAEAQRMMDGLLARAAGVPTATREEAVDVIMGRPHVGEKRETEVLHVRVPKAWVAQIDRTAGGESLSRSELLRRLIGGGLQRTQA